MPASEIDSDWLTDANGNRNSITYWGSREAAQRALDSLIDCRDCTNCSDCSDCSGCSRCSDCSGCSDCSRCSGCSDCSGCSHIARLHDRTGLQGDPNAPALGGPPPVPTIEKIHAAVLAAASAPNALKMTNWHTCGTTHCRAGWVVHLAGEPGYALERFYNTELAAMKILDASSPSLPVHPPRFYDSNADALADMRRMAELEAAQIGSSA